MDIVEFLKTNFPEILKMIHGMYYIDGVKKISDVVGLDVVFWFYTSQNKEKNFW